MPGWGMASARPSSCRRLQIVFKYRDAAPRMQEGSMSRARSVGFLNAIVAGACAITVMTTPARAQSDLARAYRVIASKQLVDLTHSFSPTTPVWSGFGEAKFSAVADPQTKQPYTIPKDGFRATYYEMVGQY